MVAEGASRLPTTTTRVFLSAIGGHDGPRLSGSRAIGPPGGEAETDRGHHARLMLTFPPDFTFVIQLISFFGLLFVLARVLFAPYLALLDERRARTVGDAAEAVEQRAHARALAARIDEELARARAEAMTEVDVTRRQAKEEEHAIFASAQADASARLADLRGGVASATAEARRSLAEEARTLADQMVGAVLGTRGNA